MPKARPGAERLRSRGLAAALALLLAVPVLGAPPSPAPPLRLGEKSTGDLDGMIKRRRIRVLVVFEPNVHAGVKYLRFMTDQYFRDAGMDGVNRALFAFAAYNAGPAKISRLRWEAAAAGLDPNLWLNHVEVIAARRIGRETVQYVSNIFKYYVAYRLVMEEQAERARAREALQPR